MLNHVTAITAHWIDINFRLHEALLSFRRLEGAHTGNYMAKVLFEILEDFEITEKLYCITSDGASNNKTMTKDLSQILKEEKDIDWDHEQMHILCLDHIINLAVQAFILSIKGKDPTDEPSSRPEPAVQYVQDADKFKDLLEKIRKITRVPILPLFFVICMMYRTNCTSHSFYLSFCTLHHANIQSLNGSPQMWEIFTSICQKEEVKPLRMRLDVKTQWNSTYTMLARAVHLRPALDRFLREHSKSSRVNQQDKITPHDWELIEMLVSILHPFKICTESLESTSRPGMSLVFWTYEELFNNIDKLNSSLTRAKKKKKFWAAPLLEGITRMKDKLSKYYEKTTIPFIYPDATILDPFSKLLLFEQASFDEAERNWKEEYKNACRERFIDNYQKQGQTGAPNSIPSDSLKRKRDVPEYESEFNSARRKAAAKKGRSNEFDRYINNDFDAPSEFYSTVDILKWWKINGPNYPELSMMARDIHAVPAVGAGVERAFSKSGRVVRPDRARLSHRTITESMMYKDLCTRYDRKLLEPPTGEDAENNDEIDDDSYDSTMDIAELNSVKRVFKRVARDEEIVPSISDDEDGSEQEEDIYGP